MAGLAVQNFVSAAVGMAVLAAVIRGFASRGAVQLGNFWVDLIRTLLYILLPLSILVALLLVSQGVIQTLAGHLALHDPGRRRADPGARPGRLAGRDQAARNQRRRLLQRQRAMPFENPNGLSNFVEVLFILLIPAAADGDRSAAWSATAARAGRCTRR